MIVADTNLILYLLLDTERTGAAEAAFERDPEWHAPPLWESECRNALVLYLRNDLITAASARAVMAGARTLLGDRIQAVADTDVFACALSRGISAYDAEFVALAEMLGVQLVTDDQRVLKACPDLAVSVEHFAVSSTGP